MVDFEDRERNTAWGYLVSIWRFLRRYPTIPIVVITLLVFSALFGPTLAPHDPLITEMSARYVPPPSFEYKKKVGSWDHPLGTDHVGRDILSRIMWGGRISLMVAGIALIVGLTVGTAVGLISGYFGGIVDEIITRIVDIWLALPFLMVALLCVLIFGQSLIVLLFLLGLLSWVGFVRIIRAQTLQIKESDYVALARVSGAS